MRLRDEIAPITERTHAGSRREDLFFISEGGKKKPYQTRRLAHKRIRT